MSKVAVKGNASGTGTFTIEAPNSNTNRTLTLPDEAGTVLTSNTAIPQAQIATALNATGSAPIYACRAWVNFSGTTSPGTIRASGNVSSVTKNGAGDFTVNFTTAMSDANYSTVCVCEGFSGGAIDNATLQIHNSVAPTSSSVRIQSKRNAATSFFDMLHNNVSVFR